MQLRIMGYLYGNTPGEIIEDNNFLNIVTAIKNIHFPEDELLLIKARERFKYEELFYIETLVALRKYNFIAKAKGIKFRLDKDNN